MSLFPLYDSSRDYSKLSATAGSWVSADYMEERFGKRCDDAAAAHISMG